MEVPLTRLVGQVTQCIEGDACPFVPAWEMITWEAERI